MPEAITVRVPGKLEWQQRVTNERKRFNVLVKGRRAGGTTLAVRLAIKSLLQGKSVGWFSATYKLLAEAEREILKRIEPIIRKRQQSEHRYETITDGVLELWSLDGELGARGRKYDRAVVDEAAFVPDMREKWEQQIRPALADLQGDAWFVSSPNGSNFFRVLFERGQDPEWTTWAAWQLPTWVNPRIPASEIEDAKRGSDESNFRQEWGAEFVVRSGAVFPSFRRDRNVRHIEIDHSLPVHIGMDFGFRTFAAVLFQLPSNGQVHIVGEYGGKEQTTSEALMGLARLPHGNGKPFSSTIATIGCDPAGSGRNVQTGRSDVHLARQVFPGARVAYSTAKDHHDPEWRASRIRDLILSADGTVRLFVDERCKNTIRMLENLIYPEHKEGKEEKQAPVKDGVNDHWSDALGYGLVATMWLRPSRMVK